uniref:Uncharacterized protein n=1 Tax=Romanomermis culicivorax TaxID=13658 RepID=A0A915ILT3_ROMCU
MQAPWLKLSFHTLTRVILRPIHTHPITLYTLKDSRLSEEDQQDGVSRTACLGITLKR